MPPPQQADLMAVSGNYAIVKLSGRQFPGVMMQGDTFHSLIGDLKEAREGTMGEAAENLEYVIEALEEVRAFYEETVRANGFRLPYFRDDRNA